MVEALLFILTIFPISDAGKNKLMNNSIPPIDSTTLVKVVKHYTSGQDSVIYFINEKNQMEGSYREFYKNGIIKYEGFLSKCSGYEVKFDDKLNAIKIVKNLNEMRLMKTGQWLQYFENGNIKVIENYTYIYLTGDKEYYSNDEIEDKTFLLTYLIDCKNGKWFFFNNSGLIIKVENWSTGNLIETEYF